MKHFLPAIPPPDSEGVNADANLDFTNIEFELPPSEEDKEQDYLGLDQLIRPSSKQKPASKQKEKLLLSPRTFLANQQRLHRWEREVKTNEPKLYAAISRIWLSGRGLFTLSDIPKGQALDEYVGRVYHTKAEKKAFHKKYGLLGPYSITVRETGDIIDPSQDPNDVGIYNKSQFANDCLNTTANYMRKIAHQPPCSNNAYFDEVEGRVFLIAARDLRAGEEIFVNYSSSYWGSSRERMAKLLANHLKSEYQKNPKKTFTAAELMVDLWPRLQMLWGKSRRNLPLQQITNALRISSKKGPNQMFERSKTPETQTMKQFLKYRQAWGRPYRAYWRDPPSEPIQEFKYKIAKKQLKYPS
jgi:hypothetical protein